MFDGALGHLWRHEKKGLGPFSSNLNKSPQDDTQEAFLMS